MRDRPDQMARNLKEKIVNLGQLVRGDPTIRTHWIKDTSVICSSPMITNCLSSNSFFLYESGAEVH